MRLISFLKDNQPALAGRLDAADGFVELSAVAPDLPKDLSGLLRADALPAAAAAIRDAAGQARFGLTEVSLLPPITDASKIICLGLNYKDHAAEGGHEPPEFPALFMRGASSLSAHGKPIVRPRVSTKLDYEAELVAVVGKAARHVAEIDAHAVIAGYSIFNDATVRDYQRLTSQWTIGKNFDATGAFGPEFVSADELPPGAAGLRITSRLNGRLLQDANTRDMIFGVAKTVALITRCMTLAPGDLIVMGTPAGVGYAQKPPVWMKDGDVCEIEIESIGVLRNTIRDEVAPAESTAA